MAIIDEPLFFSRRLGYGLAPNEDVGPDIRAWAVGQISSVPPLDFHGPNQTNLRKDLPDYAEPVTNTVDACKAWGELLDLEEELQAELGSENVSSFSITRRLEEEVWKPQSVYPRWRDSLVQTLTAVHGPAPVFERFWAFWVNHFAVRTDPFVTLLYGAHTRSIRDNMTGTFSDLLVAGALSPAMSFFLDNWHSTGPDSPFSEGGTETVNENLARELHELHTTSPAGSYSQADITETAYALTGWTFWGGAKFEGKRPEGVTYGTYFDKRRHQPGSREIKGKKYKSKGGGSNQALDLMRDLAADEVTIEFISAKLVRHFVADIPPRESVDKVKSAWIESNGNLIAIHTAVIDEVLRVGLNHTKFSSPQTWLYQLHRMSGAPVPLNPPWQGGYWIDALLDELGQPYGGCPQPDGWSDLEADWVSKELLMRRIRYASIASQQKSMMPEQSKLLVDIAKRLAPEKSLLVESVVNSGSPSVGMATLFCSPQFLWT